MKTIPFPFHHTSSLLHGQNVFGFSMLLLFFSLFHCTSHAQSNWTLGWRLESGLTLPGGTDQNQIPRADVKSINRASPGFYLLSGPTISRRLTPKLNLTGGLFFSGHTSHRDRQILPMENGDFSAPIPAREEAKYLALQFSLGLQQQIGNRWRIGLQLRPEYVFRVSIDTWVPLFPDASKPDDFWRVRYQTGSSTRAGFFGSDQFPAPILSSRWNWLVQLELNYRLSPRVDLLLAWRLPVLNRRLTVPELEVIFFEGPGGYREGEYQYQNGSLSIGAQYNFGKAT